jgi:hypothetical protein
MHRKALLDDGFTYVGIEPLEEFGGQLVGD